jgi:hypothetical protein
MVSFDSPKTTALPEAQGGEVPDGDGAAADRGAGVPHGLAQEVHVVPDGEEEDRAPHGEEDEVALGAQGHGAGAGRVPVHGSHRELSEVEDLRGPLRVTALRRTVPPAFTAAWTAVTSTPGSPVG